MPQIAVELWVFRRRISLNAPAETKEGDAGAVADEWRETDGHHKGDEQRRSERLCAKPDGELGGGVEHGLGSNVDDDGKDQRLDADSEVDDVALAWRQREERLPCAVEVGARIEVCRPEAGWS